MAEDIIKPAGSTKASKPDAGGGVIRSVPVIGVVKNNIDPTRAGRIQVYISDLGNDNPDDPDGWATVSYLSPFYGYVQPTAPQIGDGDFVANPASYGMWYSAPDLETEVICIFVNGDPNYGFYIGAIPKPEALHMVPAIGGSSNVIANNLTEANNYGGVGFLPVTNINVNNQQKTNDNNFLEIAKPIHSYQAAIFFKQGLIRDKIRGPITSSANRESPSRVGWGVSTPGRPIYAGGFTDATIAQNAVAGNYNEGLRVISRVGGHSIVLDDGDLIGRNNLMRLRTSAGHQITMSDDGQTIFITHSNGQSYVELGKEGTVDIFSTNSFNVRTQGDINLHADTDINIHAKKTLNIKAGNINVFSEQNTTHRTGNDYTIQTVGKYNLRVGKIMSMNSGDIASFASASTTYVNGKKINLNTGFGPAPDQVAPLPDKLSTDTLYQSIKGYVAAPGTLKTITTRTPAHAPWLHANQGVNLQSDLSAQAKLPSTPTRAASSVIKTASATPAGSVTTPAALSTVPPVPPISNNLDNTDSLSLISATAVNAASGPGASAVSTGSNVIQTTEGPAAVIGKLGQNPKQLDNAGILKPGSSVLVDSLVKSGVPLSDAMPPNLFTGKDSVNNLDAFVNNQDSQVSSMVSNFQQAQTKLTNAGLITGNEDSSVLGSLVMAGTTAGVDNTLELVKQTTVTEAPRSAVNIANSVTCAINIAKSAINLGKVSVGGLGTISNAVTAANGSVAATEGSSQGIAAAAVNTISNSIPALPVQVPVNLSSLEQQSTELAEFRSSGILQAAGQAGIAINFLNKPIASATAQSIATPVTAVVPVAATANKAGAAVPNQNRKTSSSSSQFNSGLATLTTVAAGAAVIANQVARISNTTRKIGSINRQIGSIGELLNGKNIARDLTSVGGITSGLGRIASILGNKSLARSLNQTTRVLNASSRLSRALGNFANSKNKILQSGNIVSAIGSLGAVLGNKSLANTARKINKQIRIANEINKAVTGLGNIKSLGDLTKVIGTVGRIGGLTGNKSLAAAARKVNTVLGASNRISKTLKALGNAKTLQGQLSGIGRLASSVGVIGNVFGNKSLLNTTRQIGSVVKTASSINRAIGSIQRSIDALTKSRNANSALGSVNSTITNASRITGVFNNAQKASGISLFPGGIASVSSVINKSLGSLAAPKNNELSSIITDASATVTNKIDIPENLQSSKAVGESITRGLTAMGSDVPATVQTDVSSMVSDFQTSMEGLDIASFSNIQNEITNELTNLQDTLGGLSSTALSQLPFGEAQAVASAAGSIGFGGAGALQLPTVGENTFNQIPISVTLENLLSDKRIPSISLIGNDPDPVGLKALETAVQQNEALDSILNEFASLQGQVDQALEKYLETEAQLPPGDITITDLRENYINLQNKADVILGQISEFTTNL